MYTEVTVPKCRCRKCCGLELRERKKNAYILHTQHYLHIYIIVLKIFREHTGHNIVFSHDIKVSGIDGVVQTPPFLHFNGLPCQQATRFELVFKSAATASHSFFFFT